MTKSVKNFLLIFGYIFVLIFVFLSHSIDNIYSLIFLGIFLVTLIPFTQKKIYKAFKIRFSGSKILFSLILLLLTIYSSSLKNAFLDTSLKSELLPTITSAPDSIAKDFFRVVRVVDGDTIEVTKNNVKSTIRLIGVDTPELLDPRKTVECFAKEASEKTKSILTNQNVYLEIDPTQGDKDKYNRLLRYVFLENGVNFNKQLLLEGFAHEYTYNLPYKYQNEFKEAENIARITKKGLWHESACINISTIVTPAISSGAIFSCSVKKESCSEMYSCEEAFFYFKTCGILRLDGNNDGKPCERICK